MEEWLVTLATIPKVVGSIPTRDKHSCDKHLCLFCVWVYYLYKYYICISTVDPDYRNTSA